jgi:hypothetical protein
VFVNCTHVYLRGHRHVAVKKRVYSMDGKAVIVGGRSRNSFCYNDLSRFR